MSNFKSARGSQPAQKQQFKRTLGDHSILDSASAHYSIRAKAKAPTGYGSRQSIDGKETQQVATAKVKIAKII